MLAAVAPAAIRRVNGLRRVAPLPGAGKWSFSGAEVDRAPLLVLWDSLVPHSRAAAGPLWSRFLSSSASGSGRDGEGVAGGSDGSKEGEGGAIPEAVRDERALTEECSENLALGENRKSEASGKWPYRLL